MKIDPAERSTETDGTAEATVVDDEDESETATDGTAEATVVDDSDESASESAVTGEVEPLTIGLPDGSESVSEAILSHRQMLTNPSEHGLVAASEAEDVRETVADLSERVPEELEDELAELETSVEGLADRLDRQDRQIEELRATVTSLADILGASVEFRTFDGDEDDEAADA
jgi:chromosome segregation ATPase